MVQLKIVAALGSSAFVILEADIAMIAFAIAAAMIVKVAPETIAGRRYGSGKAYLILIQSR